MSNFNQRLLTDIINKLIYELGVLSSNITTASTHMVQNRTDNAEMFYFKAKKNLEDMIQIAEEFEQSDRFLKEKE